MSQPNEKPSSNSKKFATALEFLEQIKKVFFGLNKHHVYTEFLVVMQDFKMNSVSTHGVVARVKELFKGHPQLILGFNPFLPPAYQITEEELKEEEKPAPKMVYPGAGHQPTDVLDNARQYVQKIKTRFTNEPQVYKSFLKILYNFKNEKNHTVHEVYDQIVVLFNRHQDLIDEFSQFLSDVETPAAIKVEESKKPNENTKKANDQANPVKSTRQKRPPSLKSSQGVEEISAELITHEDLEIFEEIKKGLQAISPGHWNDCLKILEMYNIGVMGRKETISIIYRLLGDGETFEKLRVFMNISREDFDRIKNITFSSGINVDEDDDESLEDEDEDENEERRVKVFSYYYEEDDEENVFSGQTELDKSVLNNNWVSQPPRRDDYRFKASPKNIYEENLFECEDGRYEMDLLSERNVKLKLNLVKLENDWKTKTVEERRNFPLEDLIGIIQVEYLKGLYGPEYDEILRLLVLYPSAVIPTLVTMLNRKEVEIKEKKIIFSEKWKVICVENSLKSLDHRGQYWKEQETINLKARNILANISDSFRKRQIANNLPVENQQQTDNNYNKKFDIVWTRKDFILFSSLKELLLEAKTAFFSKSLTVYLLNKDKDMEITEVKKEEKKEEIDEAEMKKVDRLLFYIESFLSCCLSPNTESHTNGMSVENNNNNKNNNNNNNTSDSKILYADKNLVVLWRYFEILLDQLHIAWNFEAGANEHVKFKQHMQHMVMLMNGKMEAANFEEKCMSLFGASSYFLFSADTLLDAIFKYMKLILSDSVSGELCCKLIEEFLNKKNEKEYQENCSKILKAAHQPLYEIVISSKIIDSLPQNNNNNISIEVSQKEGPTPLSLDGEKVKNLKRSSEVLNENDSGRTTKKAKLDSTREFQITIQQLS
jgi:histone deacetylase complex regulatory component SIN3